MFSFLKAGAALLEKLKQPASDPEVSREEAEARIGAALQDWVIPELEKHHRLHPMDKKNLAKTLLGKHGACLRILDGPGSLESRLPQVLQLALSDPDLYSSTFVWARVAKQYLPKDFRPIYPERVVEYVPLTFEWVGTQSWSNTAEEAWIRKEAVDWVFPTLAKKVPSAHQSEVEDILNRWLQDGQAHGTRLGHLEPGTFVGGKDGRRHSGRTRRPKGTRNFAARDLATRQAALPHQLQPLSHDGVVTR